MGTKAGCQRSVQEERPFAPRGRPVMTQLQDHADLSEREGDVLRLAAEGMTDKEIARRLNITPKTVRTYWDRMRLKLDAASRTEVLAKAVQSGSPGLSQSLSHWKALVEDLPLLFVVLDSDLKVVYANREALSCSGYSLEEAVSPDGQHKVIPRSICAARAARGQRALMACADGTNKEIFWFSGKFTSSLPGWTEYRVGVDCRQLSSLSNQG